MLLLCCLLVAALSGSAVLTSAYAQQASVGEMPGPEDFAVLPDGRLVVSADDRRKLRGPRITSGLYFVHGLSETSRAVLAGRDRGFDALDCPLRLQGVALDPSGERLYAINKTGAQCDGGDKHHDRVEIYAIGPGNVLRYEGALPVWEGRDLDGNRLPHSLNDLVVDAEGRVHASANPGNLRMGLGYRKARTTGRVMTYDPTIGWTARDAELAQPNGLLIDGDRLLVTTTGPKQQGVLLALPLEDFAAQPTALTALPGIPDNLTLRPFAGATPSSLSCPRPSSPRAEAARRPRLRCRPP